MGVNRRIFLLFFSLWGMSLVAQALTPPESLALTVYFSERPPFSIVEGQKGILVNLTKSILAEAGIRARFIELPANRVLELLRLGQPDALGLGWFRLGDFESWGPVLPAPLPRSPVGGPDEHKGVHHCGTALAA